MKCKHCNEPICDDDVTCVGICDGGVLCGPALDIIVKCPNCGNRLNGFLLIEELLDLDKEAT